jgi:uncharacterized protein (TIGR02266 family)
VSDMNTRREKRTPVTLKIKFKSATLDQFIERYSVDVSHGGIFIRTKDPLAVGTQLRFEFQLQDASPLISGDGTVVWIREFDPTRVGVAPGMGVRFDRLVAESEPVLQRILAQKNKDHADQKFDSPIPKPSEQTRVAPLSQVQGLAARSAQPPLRPNPTTQNPPRSGTIPPIVQSKVGHLTPPRASFPEEPSRDQTPLPKPMPFHSAADDDFSDDVFDQPTKVASLESLLKQAAGETSEDDDALTVNKPIPRPPEATPPPAAHGDRPNPAKTMLGMGPMAIPPPPAGVKPMPATAAPQQKVSGTLPKADPAPAHRISATMPKAEPAVLSTPSAADVPRSSPTPSPGSGARPLPQSGSGARKLPDASPTPQQLPRSPSGPVAMQMSTEVEKPWTSNWPEPAPAPKKPEKQSSTGILVGGLVLAGAAAAAGWWFFLREPDATAVARGVAPPAATPPTETAKPSDTPPPPDKPVEEKPAVAVPAPQGTEVQVTSVPPGALLIVDGKEIGPTPQKLTGLDPTKKLALVARLDCYRETKLTADPKAPIELELAPADRAYRVTSEPAGAAIWVDGKPTGLKTPGDVKLIGRLDPKLKHTVTVKKAGRKDAEQDVAPDATCQMQGAVAIVPVALTLDAAPAAAVEPKPVRQPRPPREPVVTPDKPVEPTPEQPVEPTPDKPVDTPTPDKPVEPAPDKPVDTPTPAETPKPVETPPAEAPKPVEEKKPQEGCDPSPDAPDWAKCK